MLASVSINAQRYVIDPLFSDSAEMYVAVKADTVWKVKDYSKPIKIAKGEIVVLSDTLVHQGSLTITYGNKIYLSSG